MWIKENLALKQKKDFINMKIKKIKYFSFTASDGAKLSYLMGGRENGKAIVLLHGLGGKGKEYHKVAKKLAPKYTLLMPDYRSHGKSKYAGDFSQKQTAQDLHELITMHGLKDVVLVGMSLGVHIVLRYISDYGQDNINSIVLIDMTPKLTNNSEWKWGYNKGAYTEDMLKYDIVDIRENAKGFKERMYLDFINYVRNGKRAIDKPNILSKAAAALFFPQIFIDTWEELFSQDYRSMLSKIEVPCAIVYGNPGSIYSEGTAKYMSSRIKYSKMFAFDGIPHEGMLKQTDKVVDIIDEYTLK